MSNEIVIAIVGLLGTFCGALIAGAIQHFSQKSAFQLQVKQQKIALANIVACEIFGILEVASRRKWVEDLYARAEALRSNQEQAAQAMRLIRKEATMKQSSFDYLIGAYTRKVDELGALGDLAKGVVDFYNGLLLTQGVLESIGQVEFLEEVLPVQLAEILEIEANALAICLKQGDLTANALRAGFH